MNKYNMRKNSKRVYHNFKFVYKVMLINNANLKYKYPYIGTFDITQCYTNGTVTLQYSAIKIRYNIGSTKPYTSDTNVEDFITEKDFDDFTSKLTLIYFCLYILKLGTRYIIISPLGPLHIFCLRT